MSALPASISILAALVAVLSQVGGTDLSDGLMRRQLDLSHGHRSASFAAAPKTASARSSGSSLILPANNQEQANSYRLGSLSPQVGQPIRPQRLSSSSSALISIPANPTPNQEHQSVATLGGSLDARAQKSQPNSQESPTSVLRNFFKSSNLEMAMRQASSDESVFQPSPSIGAPGHNSDWLSPISSLPLHLTSLADQHEEPSIQSSTTEHSNHIVQTDPLATMSPPLSADNYRTDGLLRSETHESSGYPTPTGPNQDPIATNTSADFNNQVIYEGPATALPPQQQQNQYSEDQNYFFSSSERLPNNGRASNAWWAIGVGQEFERASNLTRDDYLDYCASSGLLMSNKQRTLCRTHPKIMPIVARGIKMAIDECQSRFASNRWNCSLALQSTLDEQKSSTVFGDVMKQPNRERSYLNAIMGAALAHAMTKACSQGELPEECSCDKRIRSKDSKGKIEWIACSDDIDFGAKFSRDFTDVTDNDSETTAMINAHNYEVGRRVFKSATDITCTCQSGDGGFCQTKRCWKHLSPFVDIGDELVKRYEGATHVQTSNRDPHKLRPVRRGVRKPKRKDLVFIDESPDYCSSDSRFFRCNH